MNKKLLILLMVIGVALLFITTGIQAGTEVADTFKMETKEYKKHKKSLVEFSHKKHNIDYKISCGDCHHDKDGKPLDIKMGDDVQRCVECHSKLGQAPKSKDKKKKLSKKAKRDYHAEAVHQNCIDCHKAFKKETKKKTAPTSCTKCHPKKKK